MMRFRRAFVRRFAWLASLSIAAPILAMTPSSAGAQPPGELPPTGLPPGLQPTEVNVYPTLDRALLGPQLAVNPTDPDNIVLTAVADQGYTQACIAAGDPDCDVLPTSFGILTPRGYFETPGFLVKGVFVSFDHGQTWTKVDISDLRVAGRPELDSQNEGGLSVGPDGTFYIQYNSLDWGTPQNFAPAAGVAVTKSTDGGLTWSEPVLTGTPGDFPFLTVDQSTGTVYSLAGNAGSPLCARRSCVDPDSPILTTFGDAFVTSSQDGVNWTQPHRAGGTDGVLQFNGAGAKGLAAADGVVATTFSSTSAAGCAFFVGGAAPCAVFQTSTDAGATWTRHRVPVAFPFVGGVMVAADPSTSGHFTVAVLPATRGQLHVWQTFDSGNTWSGPTLVSQDATKTHWNPWMDYSPGGVLGLVWRTHEGAPFPALSPYSIWAATSDDGGQTFDVLKVNSGSPPAKTAAFLGLSGNIGQDRSAIALGDHGQRVYVAWGDWRTGERNIFFSAIKLKAFEFGP